MEKKLQSAARSMRVRTTQAAESEKIRFGLVGVINTFVDFVVLNILVGLFGVMIIPANIASTTVAMLTSFGLNKRVVFHENKGSIVKQIMLFFAVTLTAIWIVQSSIMFMAFHFLEQSTGWNETVLLNVAKLCGISAGLVWNYIWYSKVVFRRSSAHQK